MISMRFSKLTWIRIILKKSCEKYNIKNHGKSPTKKGYVYLNTKRTEHYIWSCLVEQYRTINDHH